MGEFALVTRALSKTFDARRAIDNVNLKVPTGSSLAIIGNKSAGKTTLLRLLLGLLEPSEGTIEVLGYDVQTSADHMRQVTGVLWGDAGVYERLTVTENLEYYGHIWHMRPADLRARTRDLLTRLSIWDTRNFPAHALNQLQQRRLTLARAVIHHPLLLLADEPTSFLSPEDKAAFHTDLDHLLTQESMTCIFTTADFATARSLATHIAVLRHGQVVTQGPVGSFTEGAGGPVVEIVGRGFSDEVMTLIRRRREVEAVQRIGNRLILQLSGEHDTAPLVSLLVEASADVEEVRRHASGSQTVLDALMYEET